MENIARRCTRCGTRLSGYNRTNECLHHPAPPPMLPPIQAQTSQRFLSTGQLPIGIPKSPMTETDSEPALSAFAENSTRENTTRNSFDPALDPHRPLTADRVIKTICTAFGVSREQLLGRSRKASLVHARQITMFLLRTEMLRSYPEIANDLCRDHTTVMWGVQQIQKLIGENKLLAQHVHFIKSQLSGRGKSRSIPVRAMPDIVPRREISEDPASPKLNPTYASNRHSPAPDTSTGKNILPSKNDRTTKGPVTKRFIIEVTAHRTKQQKHLVENIIETVLGEITQALQREKRVTFSGFGTFSTTIHRGHIGVNPRTKERIQIPAVKTPRFRAGIRLKKAVRAITSNQS